VYEEKQGGARRSIISDLGFLLLIFLKISWAFIAWLDGFVGGEEDEFE